VEAAGIVVKTSAEWAKIVRAREARIAKLKHIIEVLRREKAHAAMVMAGKRTPVDDMPDNAFKIK
jgi:hypothetical protein